MMLSLVKCKIVRSCFFYIAGITEHLANTIISIDDFFFIRI